MTFIEKMIMKLSFKINFLILLTLSVLLTVFGWSMIRDEEKVLNQIINTQGYSLARTISLFSIDPLLTENYSILETFIDTLGSETKTINSIKIILDEAIIINYNNKELEDQSSVIFKADIELTASETSPKYKLGEVILSLSNIDKNNIVATRIKIIIVNMFFIFTVLLVSLTLILEKVVLRKIAKLTNFTDMSTEEQHKEIKLKWKVNKKSKDEINILHLRFAKMLERVREREIEKDQVFKELKNAKSFLNNVIDSMPSMLVGVDSEGIITNWNLEATKITGIPAKRAAGMKVSDLLPKLSEELDKVKIAIRDRKVQKKEKISSRSDGITTYSDLTVYPLITNGISGAVIRIDDATNRVRIEEMMIQTEKMMSVGGLAAGMAHEINNPLGIILQGIQNTFRRISPDLNKNIEVADECGIDINKLNKYLEKRNIINYLNGLKDAGKRAAVIVKNMLNFSRRSESNMEPVNINSLLDETIELAFSDYDLKKKYDFKHIKIKKEYAGFLPEIICTKTEIEQVVLNLLKNSAQAISKRINKEIKPLITLITSIEGSYIKIELRDNGTGMDENVKKRVFEPFFTTKGVGVGTGLGLSVSYFIITNNHNGTMTVESEPGKGTSFYIMLPMKRGKNG